MIINLKELRDIVDRGDVPLEKRPIISLTAEECAILIKQLQEEENNESKKETS
jgi:hypothetical protein